MNKVLINGIKSESIFDYLDSLPILDNDLSKIDLVRKVRTKYNIPLDPAIKAVDSYIQSKFPE